MKDEPTSESFGIFKKPAGLTPSAPETAPPSSVFGAPPASNPGSLFGKPLPSDNQSEKPIFGQSKIELGQSKSTFGSGSVFGKSPFENAPPADEKKTIFGEKSSNVFATIDKPSTSSFGSKKLGTTGKTGTTDAQSANNPFLRHVSF